jgi:hypothetical protein
LLESELAVEWRVYDLGPAIFRLSLDERDAFVTTGSRASAYDGHGLDRADSSR